MSRIEVAYNESCGSLEVRCCGTQIIPVTHCWHICLLLLLIESIRSVVVAMFTGTATQYLKH